MDEIYFHLSRRLEALQGQVEWGIIHSRQLGQSWLTILQQHVELIRNCQLGDQCKQITLGFKNALVRASTALAQPSEMYNQLYELLRIEMPILYPGSAGFLTGAVIGIIIGLSFQHAAIPVHKMKAVVCMAYDGLDSVSCIDDFIVPSITQKNQVLIQVKAASVDIIDIRICAGYGRVLRRLFGSSSLNMRYGFPVTLGRDCSGIVVDIGPGVQKLDIGDEVWAVSPFWAPGTISEYVLLPEEFVAKKPRVLQFEVAASLPYAGSLAYSACLRAGIIGSTEMGKRVLIQSGVSPAGCVATQLASHSGWEVTVTCSALGAPIARALGAHKVVTYGAMDLEEQLMRDRFDVVLNTVGGVSNESCKLLCKPDGIVVSTAPEPIPSDNYNFPIAQFYSVYWKTKQIFMKLTGRPNQWTDCEFSGAILDKLATLVDEGKMHPVVDKILKPQNAIFALQHCDSADAVGKTVIQFRGTNNIESKKKVAGMYVTSL